MPQPAPVTDDYARHVLARLVDFFTDEGTPWPRRLWDIGSILALEELWEANSWQAAGVLSQSACDWQRNQLRVVIGPDVGLGERELRREVTEILSNPLTESSAARRRLRQVIDHAKRSATSCGTAGLLPTGEGHRRRVRVPALEFVVNLRRGQVEVA